MVVIFVDGGDNNGVYNYVLCSPRVDDEGSLFIYNVTEEDAGTYECNAQNLVGYTTARAIITIQGQFYFYHRGKRGRRNSHEMSAKKKKKKENTASHTVFSLLKLVNTWIDLDALLLLLFLLFTETARPHAGDEFLEESFEEAQEQVDRAVNDTIRFDE